MTNFEFMTLVSAGTINEEVIAKATAWLEKDALDKEKAKAKRAEVSVEKQALIELLGTVLTSTPQSATELADALVKAGGVRPNDKEGKGITRQFVSTLMRTLIDNGTAVKETVKDGKTSHVAYKAC